MKCATSVVVLVSVLSAVAAFAVDSSPTTQPKNLVLRQLWASAPDTSGAITPDGKSLSFVDWDTGDLAVRDLVTGQNRRLTKKGTWDDNSQFAEASLYSPDGKQLAYSWFDGERNYQLRLLSVEDAKPRVLMTNGWVWPTDWSGDSIAVVTSTNRRNEIVLFSVTNQSVRVLKATERREVSKVSFSPDGQFVAYSCRTSEDRQGQSDVWVHELSSGKEYHVVSHPADDKLVAWTPDGSGILVTSDRRGSPDLWFVPLEAGKSPGAWTLIKTDVGELSSMGYTKAGLLHYGTYYRTTDLYEASVDLDSGKLLSAAKELPSRYTKPKQQFWLSPTGRQLTFYQGPFNKRTFTIQDLTTGEARELPSVPSIPPNPTSLAVWSENDEYLAFRGTSPRNGVHLLNIRSGQLTTVQMAETNSSVFFWGAQFHKDQLKYLYWQPNHQKLLWMSYSLTTGEKAEQQIEGFSEFRSADGFTSNPLRLTPTEDGKKLFYGRREKTDAGLTNFVAVARDLASGSEVEFLRSTNAIDLTALSPSGNLVAISVRPGRGPETVKVFDLASSTKEKFSVELTGGARTLPGWYGTRPLLLITRRITQNAGTETPTVLCTLSAETGEMKETALKLDRPSIAGVTRDGRVVFHKTKWEGEVWSIENLMSHIAKK